jgi:hypothetical protein
MTTAGDYTVLRQIIGNYSFQGGQAFTTSQPIITTNGTPSTGTGTGSLVVSGGASVSGNLYANNTRVPITQYSTIVLNGGGTGTVTMPTPYTTSYNIFLSLPSGGAIPSYSGTTLTSFNISGSGNGTVAWATIGV